MWIDVVLSCTCKDGTLILDVLLTKTKYKWYLDALAPKTCAFLGAGFQLLTITISPSFLASDSNAAAGGKFPSCNALYRSMYSTFKRGKEHVPPGVPGIPLGAAGEDSRIAHIMKTRMGPSSTRGHGKSSLSLNNIKNIMKGLGFDGKIIYK